MEKPPDILSSEIREAMQVYYDKFHNPPILTEAQFAVIEYFRTKSKQLAWEKIAQFMETEFGIKMGGEAWCKRHRREIIRREQNEQKGI